MAVSTPPQPQQYCLRWNNHQHNLLSVFEDLLNHEAFVDVTLACDGLNLKAHKMVLSACSPYFQSMFYNTPDKHPVVFLKDVRYDEMKALLEFMYRGEVSVDQENLSSLLKVAEGLKIKGLADVSEGQMSAPRLPLPLSSQLPGPSFPHSLLSPEGSIKRLHSATSPNFLGQQHKRKRGRPRRLSGSEAVPLALSVSEQDIEDRGRSSESRSSPLPMENVSESEQSPIKSLKEGSRALSLSPGGRFPNIFIVKQKQIFFSGKQCKYFSEHPSSSYKSINDLYQEFKMASLICARYSSISKYSSDSYSWLIDSIDYWHSPPRHHDIDLRKQLVYSQATKFPPRKSPRHCWYWLSSKSPSPAHTRHHTYWFSSSNKYDEGMSQANNFKYQPLLWCRCFIYF